MMPMFNAYFTSADFQITAQNFCLSFSCYIPQRFVRLQYVGRLLAVPTWKNHKVQHRENLWAIQLTHEDRSEPQIYHWEKHDCSTQNRTQVHPATIPHFLGHETLQFPASLCLAKVPLPLMKKGPSASPNWTIRLCFYCHKSLSLQQPQLCPFILPFVLNGGSPVPNILINLWLNFWTTRNHLKYFLHLHGQHQWKHAASVAHMAWFPENNTKCNIYSSL
jgi:hypothetical protein